MPLYCYAYQCLDIIKMYKYAKFDANMPCGSMAMNLPRTDGRMLGKSSSIQKAVSHASDQTMLICISMHNLIKIDHVVQKL